MKRVSAAGFPQMQQVFSGYLHEDFVEEYETPAAALRAFMADADAEERDRFRTETQRFLDRTARLDFRQVKALLARLGCRWTPRSREALVEVLAEAASLFNENEAED
jgi:hypothetical protein